MTATGEGPHRINSAASRDDEGAWSRESHTLGFSQPACGALGIDDSHSQMSRVEPGGSVLPTHKARDLQYFRRRRGDLDCAARLASGVTSDWRAILSLACDMRREKIES
jgi:hypothetical protein